MADEVDVANEVNELRLTAFLSAREKSYCDSRHSAKNCVECYEVIPKERRIALPGVQLCVSCQEIIEKNQVIYGRL